MVELPYRRILKDAREDERVGNRNARPLVAAQLREADTDLLDAALGCADEDAVAGAKRTLDQDVDAVDEAAPDVLQREADAEGRRAEHGRERRPARAEDADNDRGADDVDAEAGSAAEERAGVDVDVSGLGAAADAFANQTCDPDGDNGNKEDLNRSCRRLGHPRLIEAERRRNLVPECRYVHAAAALQRVSRVGGFYQRAKTWPLPRGAPRLL